ncbi:hypothetical protein KCU61_g1264, partial [Aureobasidium melanogenum]
MAPKGSGSPKTRTGTFTGKDYMLNGQFSALQEKGMAGCSKAHVLVDGLQTLLRTIHLEKTLPIPADATLGAIEEDQNLVSKALGAVNRTLRQRRSDLEQLKKLRYDILDPFFNMAQNPENFAKTTFAVATIQHVRETAWHYLTATRNWQDAREQPMLDRYKLKLGEAVAKTIEVQEDEVQPYKDILQGTLSEGDILDVERLWQAAKNAFKEFSESNQSSVVKITGLEATVKSLEKEKSDLMKELDSAKEQAASANTEAEVDLTQETRVADLENEVQELESRVEGLENEKEQRDQKIKTLKEDIQALETALPDISNHPSYKKALDDIDTMWFGTLALGAEAIQIQEQAKEYKRKNRKLEKEFSRLQEERDNLREACETYKGQLDETQTTPEDIQKQKEDLESQVDQLSKAKEHQQRQISNLQTERDGALKKQEAVQGELKKLETTYQQAVGRMNASVEQHKKLQMNYERVLEAQTCMNILGRVLPSPSPTNTRPRQSAESTNTHLDQYAPNLSSLSTTGGPDVIGGSPQDTTSSSPSLDNKAIVQRLLGIMSSSSNLPLDKIIVSQAEIDSIKRDKTELEELHAACRTKCEALVKHVQLLLFAEAIDMNDFEKAMSMLAKIAQSQTTTMYEFPLAVAFGLDAMAGKSTDWVLSTQTYRQTTLYLELTVDQLLLHFFSVTYVQPHNPEVHAMLEALSTKSMVSEVALDRASRLDRFLYHLFDLPQDKDLLMIEVRMMEVISSSAIRAGRKWRNLADAFQRWNAEVNRLPGPRALLFEGYTQWFKSLIANEQVATLPSLLCRLTPPKQKVTERATGRVLLGSIMGPSVHAVVDLTEQQIAVFSASSEGVNYSLPSRLLELPERRLRNTDWESGDDFRMPPVRFLTDYGRDILELTRKSTTSSS